MPMDVMGKLIGDEMQQFCGHLKESHRSVVGGGIIWVGGVVLRVMFEAGRQKSHGRIVCGGKCDRDFFLCCLRALDNDVVP
jgi:hypothetical protein